MAVSSVLIFTLQHTEKSSVMLKSGYFWQPISISYSHSNWWQLKIILL